MVTEVIYNANVNKLFNYYFTVCIYNNKIYFQII